MMFADAIISLLLLLQAQAAPVPDPQATQGEVLPLMALPSLIPTWSARPVAANAAITAAPDGTANALIRFQRTADGTLRLADFQGLPESEARVKLGLGAGGAVWNLQNGKTYVKLVGTQYCMSSGNSFARPFQPVKFMAVGLAPCPTKTIGQLAEGENPNGTVWTYAKGAFELYDPATKQLPQCLDLSSGNITAGKLQIFNCDPESGNQDWTLLDVNVAASSAIAPAAVTIPATMT